MSKLGVSSLLPLLLSPRVSWAMNSVSAGAFSFLALHAHAPDPSHAHATDLPTIFVFT